MDGTVIEKEAQKESDFAGMVLGNLPNARVQNTKKGLRASGAVLPEARVRWGRLMPRPE